MSTITATEPLFLTEDEVADLTGRKTRAKQINKERQK